MFLPAAEEARVGSEGRDTEVPAGLGQGKQVSLLHMVLQASQPHSDTRLLYQPGWRGPCLATCQTLK